MTTRQQALKLVKDAKSALAEGAHIRKTIKTADISRDQFYARIKTHIIDDLSSPDARDLMTRMYRLYEKTFPIKEEREEFEKLLTLIEKNNLQNKAAPFKEQWIIIEDSVDGKIAAALNTSIFSTAKNRNLSALIAGTQHLHYIFVDPEYRALGLADFAFKLVEEEAHRFLVTTTPKRENKDINILTFAEQNAPLKMSLKTFMADVIGAKTAPWWRRHYFEDKFGFRELDFDYVQLPLQPRERGGNPCHDLTLVILEHSYPPPRKEIKKLKEITADIIRFHLHHFFDLSVAAGQYDIESDIDWIAQSKALNGMIKIKGRQDFLSLGKASWQDAEDYIHSEYFSADAFDRVPLGRLRRNL